VAEAGSEELQDYLVVGCSEIKRRGRAAGGGALKYRFVDSQA
jgi:hypothetical protein